METNVNASVDQVMSAVEDMRMHMNMKLDEIFNLVSSMRVSDCASSDEHGVGVRRAVAVNKTCSHVVVLCHTCKNAALVEFKIPYKLTITRSFTVPHKNSMMYGTCYACLRVNKGRIGGANALDWATMDSFRNSDVDADVNARTVMRKIMRPIMGNKIKSVMNGKMQTYVTQTAINRVSANISMIASISVYTDENGNKTGILSEHTPGDFFGF
ncbi:hypothetical protein CKM354_000633400 [Cercospora kikuchii]|uniref:Uncharacterized protein n=1 Tax=Cercospora kikuchii TaxID=84275 RepID=A0A9P3CRG5_9PEZI|nr:uncharacterized protein CKM354_000633400 [Cercospora kikuchii]GIZ43093.1 hypothetical protein CKM354_000633400 [Cercospora kikuchii]